MFSGGLFWMIMGALSVLVAVGAVYWAKDLGLKMTWWKWVLALVWYLVLMLTVAAPLTLVGENEPGAGLRLLPFLVVLTIVLGVGLWRLLLLKPKSE